MMGGYAVLNVLPTNSRLLTICSVACLFIAIICLLFVTRPRKMRVDPNPRAFTEKYRTLPFEDTVDQLLAILVDAFEKNNQAIETIARALSWAHAFSALGLACLTFSLLLTLFA